MGMKGMFHCVSSVGYVNLRVVITITTLKECFRLDALGWFHISLFQLSPDTIQRILFAKCFPMPGTFIKSC